MQQLVLDAATLSGARPLSAHSLWRAGGTSLSEAVDSAALPVWPSLPPHGPGMTIGLYGGSFNPPHAAHRLLGFETLRRLALQRVWCLVTPGNPLKETSELAPFDERRGALTALARHPLIDVTDIEATAGLRHTRDTIRYLQQRSPRTRFVWIMGADNLAGFHRWQGWREIAARVPIAVFDRPGWTLSALASCAAQTLARHRIDESDSRRLAFMQPPAWSFIHQPRSTLSSTAIRNGVLKSSGEPT